VKKVRLMIIIFAIIGLVGISVMVKLKENWLREINESAAVYFYISSPNGNALNIKEGGLLTEYRLKKYNFSLSEDNGHIDYKTSADILGNVKFNSTLLSGDGNVNYETDFPRCLMEKNDASSDDVFYHPSADESRIKSEKSDSGKYYVSFKNTLSLAETAAIISELSEYGEVTWLWVDTYAGKDMTSTATIQNADFDGEKLNTYGIPLYYNGERIENAVGCFLDKLNNISLNNVNFCTKTLNSVKMGIKPESGEITEKDIKVIGLVFLPSTETDRSEIYENLCLQENVRAVN